LGGGKSLSYAENQPFSFIDFIEILIDSDRNYQDLLVTDKQSFRLESPLSYSKSDSEPVTNIYLSFSATSHFMLLTSMKDRSTGRGKAVIQPVSALFLALHRF
jgi:hypothetical protein